MCSGVQTQIKHEHALRANPVVHVWPAYRKCRVERMVEKVQKHAARNQDVRRCETYYETEVSRELTPDLRHRNQGGSVCSYCYDTEHKYNNGVRLRQDVSRASVVVQSRKHTHVEVGP